MDSYLVPIGGVPGGTFITLLPGSGYSGTYGRLGVGLLIALGLLSGLEESGGPEFLGTSGAMAGAGLSDGGTEGIGLDGVIGVSLGLLGVLGAGA